ncbi:MAG: DNA/RNA nuclease SfsA, partial [Clostridiales bacterium]
MEYPRISEAIFLKRPNRFIAEIDIAGQTEICHVKNTGRCRELLLPGAKILIQEAHNPQRKTKYDLISVWKGQKLINMDAQAPNQVFGQWLPQSGLFQQLTLVRPEKSFGNSRFDFYIEADGDKIFAEIKGVTLEENGVARFPDAPTE